MKKYIISCIIVLVCFWNTWVSFAETEEYQKELIKSTILKKRELEKNIWKGSEYVNVLDVFFEKHKDNEEKISAILERIKSSKNTLWNTKKEEDIKLLLEYIELKWKLTLLIIKNNSIQKSRYSEMWVIIQPDPEFIFLREDKCYECDEIFDVIYSDWFIATVKLNSLFINQSIAYKDLLTIKYGIPDKHPHVLITQNGEYIVEKDEIINILWNRYKELQDQDKKLEENILPMKYDNMSQEEAYRLTSHEFEDYLAEDISQKRKQDLWYEIGSAKHEKYKEIFNNGETHKGLYTIDNMLVFDYLFENEQYLQLESQFGYIYQVDINIWKYFSTKIPWNFIISDMNAFSQEYKVDENNNQISGLHLYHYTWMKRSDFTNESYANWLHSISQDSSSTVIEKWGVFFNETKAVLESWEINSLWWTPLTNNIYIYRLETLYNGEVIKIELRFTQNNTIPVYGRDADRIFERIVDNLQLI